VRACPALLQRSLWMIAVLLLTESPASAGPITTSTALPVHEGELILRGQMKFTRATGDPSPLNRDLTVWAAPSVAVYGVNEKLALFGVFPYLDKELKVTTPAGRRTRGDAGGVYWRKPKRKRWPPHARGCRHRGCDLSCPLQPGTVG